MRTDFNDIPFEGITNCAFDWRHIMLNNTRRQEDKIGTKSIINR